ncbi:MAG: tyrosine--tRNA ligase [Bryobacteraceae bacterium]
MTYVDEMTWRGLIYQMSDPRLGEIMSGERLTLYSGFDPTAPSLHVGNLMPILGLRRAQLLGHRPIALVGGATGIIGDPSGKAGERKLQPLEDIERNQALIVKQLERFLDFSHGVMVNNSDWFRGMSYLEFLRDTGKHFTVNMMLAKESVNARIGDPQSGISYTEFSYMLIQAYDFLWLLDHYDCRLQIGGSEQWGNITAGLELIRRRRGKEAYAITLPLLLDSSGKKFGKTEKGAVWLDASRTSVYDFYQYFLRSDDRDVPKLLRFLTFLDQKTITELEEQLRVAPEKREAHRVLAREMTTMVHGAQETRNAEDAAAALFGPPQAGAVPAGAPAFDLTGVALANGYPLVDIVAQSGLCKSKSEARREIEAGGVYVNDQRVQQVDHKIGPDDVHDGAILLRRGKKSYMVLQIT